MLRRKKTKGEAVAAEEGEAVAPEAPPAEPQPATTDAAQPSEPVAVSAEPSAEPPDRREEAAPGHAAIAFAEGPPATDDDLAPNGPDLDELVPAPAEIKQRRPRYQPVEVPVASPYGAEEHLSVGYWVGGVKNVLTKSGTSSPEEREREAAAEFQAAIMPGLVGLRDAVPDAASPDEALQALAQREAEHEFPEDPESASLKGNDIFRSDATVYYRIRKRFVKPPKRVGWGNPWRPPPGLARPDPPHKALNRPD
ncbi:MAG: hypothetical protein ACR2HV_00900 [Acidimicrobiales bacterium]